MRSLLSALTLIIALAPAVEALAGDAHAACGSRGTHAAHGASEHAHHDAAADESPPHVQDECRCGCAHGCAAAATAVPASTGSTRLHRAAIAPASAPRPFASRVCAPPFRPPISPIAL